MPYIKQADRPEVTPRTDRDIETPGELNFAITHLVLDYQRRQGGPGYALANTIVGVLECAKAEFLRRHLAPYEDQKIAENGDVEV